MVNINQIKEGVPALQRKAGHDRNIVTHSPKNTVYSTGVSGYQEKGGGILYEYKCDEHGRFDGWNTLEKCSEPKPCPVCNESSPRAFSLVNHTWPKDWVMDGLTHDVPRRRGIDEYVE